MLLHQTNYSHTGTCNNGGYFLQVFTFSSILIFAFTRPVSSTRIEADYLKEVDPQIYALLNGEILSSPLKLMKH